MLPALMICTFSLLFFIWQSCATQCPVKQLENIEKLKNENPYYVLSGAKVAELTTNHNHEFCYAFDQEGFGVTFGGGYI